MKKFFAVTPEGEVEIDGDRDYSVTDIRNILAAAGFKKSAEANDFQIKGREDNA